MAKSAGYSGTPLAKKLGIVAGKSQRVLLIGAPAGFERLLEGLPEDAAVSRRAGRETPDVIVAFTGRLTDLRQVLDRWSPRITGAQMLWVCWPKLASGVETDVREDLVRRLGIDAGLVDNKVCAVDETWSGLRLVRPVKDRVK